MLAFKWWLACFGSSWAVSFLGLEFVALPYVVTLYHSIIISIPLSHVVTRRTNVLVYCINQIHSLLAGSDLRLIVPTVL